MTESISMICLLYILGKNIINSTDYILAVYKHKYRYLKMFI